MIETWKNLFKVKSIVTVVLTVTFVILLISGTTIPQEFIFIYNTVIAFYFGTQYQKGASEVNGALTSNSTSKQIRSTDGGTGPNASGGSV